MTRPFDRADGRPRVYITTTGDGASWALGPSGTRRPALDAGSALNFALDHLGTEARGGAVVIVEPVL